MTSRSAACLLPGRPEPARVAGQPWNVKALIDQPGDGWPGRAPEEQLCLQFRPGGQAARSAWAIVHRQLLESWPEPVEHLTRLRHRQLLPGLPAAGSARVSRWIAGPRAPGEPEQEH